MRSKSLTRFSALLLGLNMICVEGNAADVAIEPAQLRVVGKVDERFQSYNVESVEVTGGNFWAPYPKPGATQQAPAAGPHGTDFASNAYLRSGVAALQGAG